MPHGRQGSQVRGQVTFNMVSAQEFDFYPGSKGVLRNPLVSHFSFNLQVGHRSLHFDSFFMGRPRSSGENSVVFSLVAEGGGPLYMALNEVF